MLADISSKPSLHIQHTICPIGAKPIDNFFSIIYAEIYDDKTTFSPDSNINREGMVAIMKNYAIKLGYTIPKTLEAVTFADNASISFWAEEVVKSMQQAGILAGKTNNHFDPAGTVTRAEVTTVLQRFVEILIDPQTDNGGSETAAANGVTTKTESR